VRQFISDANQAGRAVKGVGTEAEQAGKKAHTSWTRFAQLGVGMAGLYAAGRFVRSAVGATEDLAKSSIALSRTTGMDVSTSSQWASVAKERGISTQQLQVGLIRLSRAMDQASTGSKTAITTWRRLGISMAEVRSGNTQQVMLDTADALRRIQNPAERAALTQTLFGRAGQRLLPIIAGGSKAIREQLAVVREYGDYLNVKTVGQLRQLIGRQREMGTAFQGMKIQVGTALLPVLLSLAKVLISILKVIQPLTHNATVLRIVIIALTTAFVAYQVAMTVATAADVLFGVTLSWVWIVATAGAVVVIPLLIAAIYLLIKHWHQVVDVAKEVWHWIARNWPLLAGIILGPVGFALIELIKHFGAVKRYATEVVDWIIHEFHRLVRFITGLPGKVAGGVRSFVGHTAHSVTHAITHPWSIFGGQAGGVVPYNSPVLVGERGPELLALPGGATVQPMPQGAARLGSTAAFGEATITTQVVLDRRVLAEAVGRFTADEMARQ
jgi:hypothetical protein